PRHRGLTRFPPRRSSDLPAAYLLSSAIFLLPAGMLGDIIGRAKVFSTGTLVYTFASLLAFFTPSASLLLACRFLQGIGGAMLYSDRKSTRLNSSHVKTAY